MTDARPFLQALTRPQLWCLPFQFILHFCFSKYYFLQRGIITLKEGYLYPLQSHLVCVVCKEDYLSKWKREASKHINKTATKVLYVCSVHDTTLFCFPLLAGP